MSPGPRGTNGDRWAVGVGRCGAQLPEFERGDILYDVSRLLPELSPTETDVRTLERVRAMFALKSA